MDKETQKEMKKNQELIDHYDCLNIIDGFTGFVGIFVVSVL